jgi:P-type Ca2+ transporter type 2C
MKRRSTATSSRKASFSTAKRDRPSARSAPPPSAPATVRIVFVTVRGRARLHVEGIRGRPACAARLQARIAGAAGVRQASASSTTGNVLVLFDPATIDLRSLIGAVARNAVEARNGDRHGDARALARADSVWHTRSAAEIIRHVGANPDTGLAVDEVARRLAALGDNSLPTPTPKSAIEIIAGHVTSLPVLLLGVAAVLSLGMGAVADAVIIGAVVVANGAVGYVTERRVERVFASLQNGALPSAFVRRDGRELMVPACELVPGDIMILKTGHTIAADARVVEADHLGVDESALTGESMPVTKIPALICPIDAPLPDRLNMVFAATVVAEGAGLAVVVGTGRDTEIGRVRSLVAETTSMTTPLERQLDHMGGQLVAASLGFCGLALGLGLLRGVPAIEMLRASLSLAVAAVPEGLPAVATTTLALGMHRMMRRQTLVRRLAAVESLGATTVICLDKTGTLTENRMTATAWHLGRREYPAPPKDTRDGREPDRLLARALAIGVLCNEAEIADDSDEISGSSTEAALLTAALDFGIDCRALRRQYPLQELRARRNGDNWMATVHKESATERLVTVKGAPEEVLALSTSWFDGETVQPLTREARAEILAANGRIAAGGMRVLALAFKRIASSAEATYDDLTWVGLVALSDPVRPGVREAIQACERAGIRPVILTGDQARTAAAIYRDFDPTGQRSPRVVEASQLAGLDPAAMVELVADVDVFARVSPAHKHQIVRALQAGGHVVAMTGDGINDAAALRAADIGVAMGARGTDVARDVADVVLMDDDFASIVQAVEQGRTIHANISKALRFLLSTNFSEILVTIGAMALGVARPLSAIQYLWINLLSDVFPALALAMEPPEPDVMSRPPLDPREPILTRASLVEIGGDAAILSATTLGVHGLAVARYGAGPQATTIAFCTLTAAQLAHALNYRSGFSRASGFPALETAVGGTLAVHLAAMTASPLRRVLGTTVLSGFDWLLVAGGVAVPLAVHGLRRALAADARSIRNGRAHEVTEWKPSSERDAERGNGRAAQPSRTAPRRRDAGATDTSSRRFRRRSAEAGPFPSGW